MSLRTRREPVVDGQGRAVAADDHISGGAVWHRVANVSELDGSVTTWCGFTFYRPVQCASSPDPLPLQLQQAAGDCKRCHR